MTSLPVQQDTRHLDDAVKGVQRRFAELSVPKPRALLCLATGLGLLPGRLHETMELELGTLEEVPAPWNAGVLVAGRLGELDVWLLEDLSAEPLEPEPLAPWARGFPLWLAAAAGAQVCVHTSAGTLLPTTGPDAPREPLAVGGFAVARDHLNLSGASPLVGLGASALGPLFPDLSSLHHTGLRHAALRRAEKLGLSMAEVVVACTPGPALETPAERTFYARAGAGVAVQGLASPLIAAAHAGLALLSLVVLADDGSGSADVPRLIRTAQAAEPALEDLILALGSDLERAADVLAGERRA